MKKILPLFLIALNCCVLKAQDLSRSMAPEKGDLVCINSHDSVKYHIVFKKSTAVYFDYEVASKRSGYTGKGDEKRINSLFNSLDKVAFDKIKSADSKKLYSKKAGESYRFLQYVKGNKTYKVIWNTNGTDKNSETLNGIVDQMNGFW